MSRTSRTNATAKRVRREAVVAVAAIAAHAIALGGGFVWLDHAHIQEGLAIARPSGWLGLFGHGFAGTGFYRPLMALSLSIDALVGGPFVFHATSLAWHAAASVTVVVAAEALGLRRRAAALAGLLFAVHPISSLVADAIAFRSEAMVATFLFAFLWAHLEKRPVAAALLLLAASLTKETGLVLAPIFAIATLRRDEATSRPTLRLLGVEALAMGAALALRAAFAPSFRASHEALGASAAIGTRAAALAKSAAALALPWDRTICDAFPVTPLARPTAIAGLALAGTVAWLAWKRRGPAALLALSLLPSLQIVPVMRWWSPHYLYVPAAFAAMLVAELADRRGDRAVLAARIASALLGVVSLVDGRRYADDSALWTPEVEARSTCREGQFYLGEVDRQAHLWDRAAARYEKALAPRPGVLAYVDRPAALENLGGVRLEQGRFDDARAAFRDALDGTADPLARRRLVHDLAAATLAAGDAAEADRLLAPETARADALPESLVVRAIALERLGRADEAAALRARVR